MDSIANYKTQIKEATGSNTFCVLPWIHIATRPNGDMRLCCTANASGAGSDHALGLIKEIDGKTANFSSSLPLDVWNNSFMRNVRLQMLGGQIPPSCKVCFDEEDKGIVSKRIWETGNWYKDEHVDLRQLIDDTDKTGKVPNKINYLDLRLGHTCNIKCVMCSPHDSSKWVMDWQELLPQVKNPVLKKELQWNKQEFNNFWYQRKEFWEELYTQIPYIKQVYFAGGEPLMIKEHKTFIEKIVEMGYSQQVLLRYNSNGLLIDKDLINLWSKFKKVKFAVSIDASYDRDEYIRYPSDFSVIENNLHLLDNTPDNIHISLATAVQIFNIKHLPDFIKWKIQNKFKKINIGTIGGVLMGGGLVNMHLVHIPTFLSITILPKEDKEEVKNIFADFKKYLYSYYTKDDNFWNVNPYGWRRWEGLIEYMESQDNSHLLPAFTEYVTKLDKIRNLSAKQTFPELRHLL